MKENPDRKFSKNHFSDSETTLDRHTLRYPSPTIHMVTTIVTMADNIIFSFNMCNFGIIFDFKKKPKIFLIL